jgi:hypothetical protein
MNRFTRIVLPATVALLLTYTATYAQGSNGGHRIYPVPAPSHHFELPHYGDNSAKSPAILRSQAAIQSQSEKTATRIKGAIALTEVGKFSVLSRKYGLGPSPNIHPNRWVYAVTFSHATGTKTARAEFCPGTRTIVIYDLETGDPLQGTIKGKMIKKIPGP